MKHITIYTKEKVRALSAEKLQVKKEENAISLSPKCQRLGRKKHQSSPGHYLFPQALDKWVIQSFRRVNDLGSLTSNPSKIMEQLIRDPIN